MALNRMAATDGISPSQAPGTQTATIHEHDTITSHLPTYFTPPTHTAEGYSDTSAEPMSGVMELADKVGLTPPHDTNDYEGQHGEMVGVPHQNDSDDSGYDDSGDLTVPPNSDTNAPSTDTIDSLEVGGHDNGGVVHDSGGAGHDNSSEPWGEPLRAIAHQRVRVCLTSSERAVPTSHS
jgi:hypothetical protein